MDQVIEEAPAGTAYATLRAYDRPMPQVLLSKAPPLVELRDGQVDRWQGA